MRELFRLALSCGLAWAGSAGPAVPAEGPTAEEVIARYLDARGGAERWRQVESLELRGTYAAISKRAPFTLIRQRDDLYRLDYVLADSPAIRARDDEGPWMLNAWLQPEIGRVGDDPYKRQLERESLFPLVLLDRDRKGIAVRLSGPTEVEGVPAIGLEVTFPDGQVEHWFLDAETYREVAVDSEVYDHTQFETPVRQRTFFDDFREVGGLVIPFQMDWEFGARLEAMTVEEVAVNPEIDRSRFSPPTGEADD